MTTPTAPVFLSATETDAAEALALAALAVHLPDAVALRHAIHAEPRLGGHEQDTRALIVDALGLPGGQDLFEGHVLRVGDPTGPAIGIRAELDALPIQEQTDRPWRSRVPGVAHLCGHDVHAAALTAVTRTLHAVGAPVPLVAVFQPREEMIPSGAADYVDSPYLEQQQIRAMIGVHLQPGLAAGLVSAPSGVMNASADNFDVVVRGRPAHGAYPHLSHDPILAAAAIVQALQQVVSRRTDPMSPAVVSVGRISGGHSHNAIPSEVLLQGTMRAYTEQERTMLRTAVRDIAEGVAAAHQCTVSMHTDLGEPVLDNDEGLAGAFSQRLTAGGFVESRPIRSCGADDFAFFSARIPSLMIFAGVGDGDAHSPGLHHPAFAPDDEAVEHVARLMLIGYFAAVRTLSAPAAAAAPQTMVPAPAVIPPAQTETENRS